MHLLLNFITKKNYNKNLVVHVVALRFHKLLPFQIVHVVSVKSIPHWTCRWYLTQNRTGVQPDSDITLFLSSTLG